MLWLEEGRSAGERRLGIGVVARPPSHVATVTGVRHIRQ